MSNPILIQIGENAEDDLFIYSNYAYDEETLAIIPMVHKCIAENDGADWHIPVIRLFESLGGSIDEDPDRFASISDAFPDETFEEKTEASWWISMAPQEIFEDADDYRDAIEDFENTEYDQMDDIMIHLSDECTYNNTAWGDSEMTLDEACEFLLDEVDQGELELSPEEEEALDWWKESGGEE